MAMGPSPRFMLLEDANDVAAFREYSGLTVPRGKWAIEAIAATQRANLEGLF